MQVSTLYWEGTVHVVAVVFRPAFQLFGDIFLIFLFRKQDLTFHSNCLHPLEKICMKCQILYF